MNSEIISPHYLYVVTFNLNIKDSLVIYVQPNPQLWNKSCLLPVPLTCFLLLFVFFFFLAVSTLLDISSWIRDGTHVPCSRSAES